MVCIIVSQVISKRCFIESTICNFSKISLLFLLILRCWFRKLHLNIVCIDLLLSIRTSWAVIHLCILLIPFRPSRVFWSESFTIFNLIRWTDLTVGDFVRFNWFRLVRLIVVGLIYIVRVLSLPHFFAWCIIWVLTGLHCRGVQRKFKFFIYYF